MNRSAQLHRLSQPAAEAYGPEHLPTFTLDRQIALARREMGETRWQKLNREWGE